MRPHSLRLRLLIGVLAAVAIAWTAVGLVAYREARHEAEELLDAHLAQSATLLFAFLGDQAVEVGEAGEHLAPHRYDKKVAFQVWQGTQLLTHSRNAPPDRLSAREEGFSDELIDGKGWRVFSAWDPQGRYLVQVADAAKSRAEVSGEVASHLLYTLGFGLPLLGVALGAFILVAFRPLARLADSIGAQAPQRLQPIALEGAPQEIVPILERLNRLFGQVRRAQEDERRFTADAAHELRTPLAVLQTHAEVASGVTDEATRQRALELLVSGSQRASRLVDQLLTLARLDAQEQLPGKEPCRLQSLVVDSVAPLIPAALAKDLEVEVDEGEGAENASIQAAVIEGAPLLLQVLVRNLVDNAIRYTPRGGKVRITLGREAGKLALHVIDSGPGIPEGLRSEAGKRFRRFDESGSEGHGLGLSIVARIAELHGASLVLEAAGQAGGLDAAVLFPLSGAGTTDRA